MKNRCPVPYGVGLFVGTRRCRKRLIQIAGRTNHHHVFSSETPRTWACSRQHILVESIGLPG